MTRLFDVRSVLAVGAGGALGSLARYGLTLCWQAPLPTLLANLTGAFLFGLLATALARQVRFRHLTLFLTTGILGGYTTFSTFMVETLGLDTAPMLGYLAGTVVGGMVAVMAGVWLGRKVGP